MQNAYKYAQFLATIRAFFIDDCVTEVETKSLLKYPTLDNNIDSIKVTTNSKFETKNWYLHTSPEIEMKKLLAAGIGDIYQICKVYRDNEIGAKNFNEFSMLEYYKLELNEVQLSRHVVSLLRALGIYEQVVRFSYAELFSKFANIDINIGFKELKNIAKKHHLTAEFANIADLQMLLFVHFVEKHLVKIPLCVVYDFPCEQSALAKVVGAYAKRFEVYLYGSEIANGYQELTTFDEYHQRFTQQAQDTNNAHIDIEFLAMMKNNPLPKCAGVALGLGRIFEHYNA